VFSDDGRVVDKEERSGDEDENDMEDTSDDANQWYELSN